MKPLLIICSVVAVAYAGVGNLSPEEESHVLELFSRVCAGGQGGDLGGYTVYCKQAEGTLSETLNHHVNVPGSQGQDQAVFVEPHPVRYLHNIQVTGSNSQAGQTKIYVLPQKADHSINTQVNPGSTTQAKPHVYFLKNGSNGGNAPSQGGYNAPQPQIISSQYGGNPPSHEPPYNPPQPKIIAVQGPPEKREN